MYAQQVCHKILDNACAWMHARRRQALACCVEAAMNGQRLTVTGLGRAMTSTAKTKHCIKRVDRLLSNTLLQGQWGDVYHVMTQVILGQVHRPVICIDWSDLDTEKQHFVLRAAVAAQGRTLTLYEEVHTLSTREKPSAHRRFLRRLANMLPTGCCPILVTDAGFRTPWFNQVAALGWDWVGRLRNRHDILIKGARQWHDCKTYYACASTTPKYLGEIQLTRRHGLTCHLVVCQGKRAGRHKLTCHGERAQSSHSNKNAAKQREPWVLVTSLPVRYTLAKRVVTLYAARMQIEEGFRDTKSAQFGLGFELNQSYQLHRIQLLLLIAMLAIFMLWILGTLAKQSGQHRQYQANSVKHTNVLSVIFIGQCIANDRRCQISIADIPDAGKLLWKMIDEHANCW
jgi:Transposase DDE domain